ETATVTVTYDGANDAPVITVGADDSSSGAVTESDATHLTAGDTLTLTDVDISDTAAAKITGLTVTGNTGITGQPTDAELLAMFKTSGNALASGETTAKINWTFDSGNTTFDFLSEGEKLELAYTITATDSNGSETSQIVTVTVTGTNDAPVISEKSGDSSLGEVTETDADHLNVNGTLTLNDVDVTDAVGTTVTSVNVAGDINIAYQPTSDELLAMFKTIGSEISAGETSDQITWTFDSGAKTFDYLAAGEKLDLSYTITATDSHGATATKVVVVTVADSNDRPEISVATGDSVAANLDETDITASGTLTLTDIDVTDNVASEVIKVDISGVWQGITEAPSQDDILKMLNTGGLELDNTETSDKILWNFNSNGASFAYLAEGEQVVLTYTIQAKDDSGKGAGSPPDESDTSDTKEITITITGSNDLPVIDIGTGSAAETVVESDAKNLTVNGTLTLSDPNVHDSVGTTTKYLSVAGATGRDGEPTAEEFNKMFTTLGNEITSGNVKGTINWTFDSKNETFDYLAAGEKLEISYEITATDSKGGKTTQIVVVTVTGSNDKPEITIAAGDSSTGALSETDTGLSTTGTLTLTDLDVTDKVGSSVVQKVTVTGTGAGLSGQPTEAALIAMFTTGGSELDGTATQDKINWAFNSGSENFNYLAEGETLVLTYTIQ
ncbi:MAG: VCBS domain-containing protein, partial [Cloacibacillus sp.]